MKLSEAALLTRKNARFYAGQLGEEKFDRVVAPHVRCRRLGGQRYYVRKDIDAWLSLDASGNTVDNTFQTMLNRM